jgi:hypothetical protein
MGTGGSLVVIDFSEQGNSASFRRAGWSGQEPDRVWGTGPRSVIRVPIQPAGRPMVLEAEVGPGHHPPVHRGQIVRVRINGTAIGSTHLDTRALIRCDIDPALAGQDGILEIEFEFPGFYRPDWLRTAPDDRPLSGWFSFVRVYTTDIFHPELDFQPSVPEIPVIGLTPPLARAPCGDARPAVYTFGRRASVMRYMRDGWDIGEGNFTWTVGTSCQLDLPAPRAPGHYILRIDAWPLIVPGKVPKQDVSVLLDGVVVGQYSLREPAAWIVSLPRELTEGRDVLPLTFVLPDATRPIDLGGSADTRKLGLAFTRIAIVPLPPALAFAESIRAEEVGPIPPIATSDQFLADDFAALPGAIEAALGMDTATLMRGFESLGDNCEFGIVQKKLGVGVLNLFRFGNAKLPDLLGALADDLKAISDPSSITIDLNDAEPREYVLAIAKYNLHWHTFTHENEAEQPKLLRDHAVKLDYLRRKFFEGLRGGRKIYVVKQRGRIPIGQAAALLLELNRHGSAALLCVEQTPDGHRSGEVELLLPNLMRGYVEKFAPETDVESADPEHWLRVIANAALLRRAIVEGPERAV